MGLETDGRTMNVLEIGSNDKQTERRPIQICILKYSAKRKRQMVSRDMAGKGKMQKERQTDRRTDRQTDKQTHRQTDRQTDRQNQTYRESADRLIDKKSKTQRNRDKKSNTENGELCYLYEKGVNKIWSVTTSSNDHPYEAAVELMS